MTSSFFQTGRTGMAGTAGITVKSKSECSGNGHSRCLCGLIPLLCLWDRIVYLLFNLFYLEGFFLSFLDGLLRFSIPSTNWTVPPLENLLKVNSGHSNGRGPPVSLILGIFSFLELPLVYFLWHSALVTLLVLWRQNTLQTPPRAEAYGPWVQQVRQAQEQPGVWGRGEGAPHTRTHCRQTMQDRSHPQRPVPWPTPPARAAS